MKLPVCFEGIYISTKSSSSVDQQGRTIYKDYVALECKGEVGNIPCTTQVMKSLSELPKFSEVTFTASLDTWSKDLIINSFKPR